MADAKASASGTNRPPADEESRAAGPPPPPSPSVAASPQWAVPSREPEGFTPFVAFCFTINYILGTGFLTIPWAFVQGGLALSALLLVIVSVLADAAKGYVLESMARAEAMLDERMRWVRAPTRGHTGVSGGVVPGAAGLVYSPLLPGAGTSSMPASPTMTAGTGTGRKDEIEADVEMESMAPLTSDARFKYGSMGGSAGSLNALARQSSLPVPSSLPGSRPGSVPGTPQLGGGGTPHDTPGAARRAVQGRQLVRRKGPPRYMVKHRKFELNALCRVFLGKGGTNLYMGFLSLYIYCTLWAYTSVFSSAMAKKFPVGFLGAEDAYAFYAIVFGAIVVPMSCCELHEQIAVQVFLTGCRFLMVFLMVGTSGRCSEESGTELSQSDPVPMFRPSGLHKMLPILVFATIYHHSIPGLAHPVANKRKLGPIFRSTTAFSGIAYTFIGCFLGAAFGDTIEQSANLNWHSYRGGTGTVDEEGNISGVAWWARSIEFYVICFPALDVLSAFPLNAITLGNNMFSAFYGRRIHEVENNRNLRIRFRLLAAIPSIILAIVVRELGTITDYAGTTGFVLTFSFPALLYICSQRLAVKKHFSTMTYYTSYASSVPFAVTIFGFGVSMLIFVEILEMIG